MGLSLGRRGSLMAEILSATLQWLGGKIESSLPCYGVVSFYPVCLLSMLLTMLSDLSCLFVFHYRLK